MIICAACGTENPETAGYCSKCARKLDADSQGAVRQLRESHTATGVRWVVVAGTAIILILLIAVVLVLVLHGV